jgi:hypothetical protein
VASVAQVGDRAEVGPGDPEVTVAGWSFIALAA